MKIAFFNRVITPEIGADLAGYGIGWHSVMKLDDLHLCGLLVDDGENKVLLASFDLLGLDEWYIRKIRKACADQLQISEESVLLTCTHTHNGPETRSLAPHPNQLNRPYLDWLDTTILEAVSNLTDFCECDVAFYSLRIDENRNRRYVTADNRASFLPHRREMIPISNEFADKELGILCFFSTDDKRPVYVIGNYAAHPLAGHGPGLGGLRISADYPGAFRDYVRNETGAECMFISGAAGDLVPKEDELGSDAFRQMGTRLGKAALGAIIDAQRNPGRFFMKNARVGALIQTFRVPLRKKYCNQPERLPAKYLNQDEVTLEIQCLAIGDVCFVGVPGELCCELGQEIKWHSPFRRTFIAYDATAYFSYICPGNFLVAGGYEAVSQRFSARGGLALLNTATNAMYELREKLFPDADQVEPYPDYLDPPLVNLPPNK
jgi:neutral ceramidase